MNKISVKQILNTIPQSQTITVEGWVKTFRANRFISLNDGSSLKNIQCVVDFEKTDNKIISKINTGTSLKIKGLLVPSLGKGQSSEVEVHEIDVLGECDANSYPIQPKKYSLRYSNKP